VSKTLAVAAREVRERWLLLPAGLVLGFLPLVLPAFGVDRGAMPFLGLVTAVLLGTAAAVLMGSTMLARDAANGRLAFLFSRPLSWPAIWGGKWLGALLLVTGTVALAAAPFMAVYPPRIEASWLDALADGPGFVAFVGLFLSGVGLTNFGATAYRSRSPWLALDLALLGGGLWVARQSVAPLWRWGIVGRDVWTEPLALLFFGAALFAASAAQTAFGRADVRRAHLAMSLVFWVLVGLTLATAAGYWRRVRLAPPAALDVYALARDPAGRWIFAEGRTERGGGYPYAQLIDTVGGRWATRPDPGLSMALPPLPVLFSADGRLAVRPGSDGRGAEALLFDLDASPPHVTHVSLESSPPLDWATSFALSPSGDAVFMAHESGASIFALPSGRRVATTTIEPGWRPAATRFVGEGAARAWLLPHAGRAVVSSRAEIRVVDLVVDGLSRTRLFPTGRSFRLPYREWGSVLPDPRGERLVTFDAGVHLRDGATGAMIATLADSEERVTTRFLSDGSVAVAAPRNADDPGSGTTIRVFGDDGTLLSHVSLAFPPPGGVVGPEVAPGRLLVVGSSLARRTLLVDLPDGRVVEELKGLSPARAHWWGPGASAVRTDAGRIQFLRDESGHVIRLDFESGARTVVTGPGAAPGGRIRIGW
jgi:hypothetical protein